MKFKGEDLRLYLITDRRWLEDESLEEVVELAIENGVSFLQLREKDIPMEEFKDLAERLRKLTRKYSIPFVVNDQVELAREVAADGVHIGQNDMSIAEAREILGDESIIGVTANNLAAAVEAEKEGADYLGIGTMFETKTKSVSRIVSMEELKVIRESVGIPIVAIGGINQANIDQFKGVDIQGVALISAILSAKNIGGRTRSLSKKTGEIFYGDY